MKIINSLQPQIGILCVLLSFSVFSISSCAKNSVITIEYKSPKKSKIYKDDKDLAVTLSVKGNPDSIILFHNNKQVTNLPSKSWNLKRNSFRMGDNLLVAYAYSNGKIAEKKYLQFKILPSVAPQQWQYKIIRKIPHSVKSFTQGLFYYNEKLYETTGQRGESKLMTIAPKSGKILQTTNLSNLYFGEGATLLNNKIYQVTWTSGTGFTYNAETLQQTGSFSYGKVSPQGWGLTTYNSLLVMSNGSHQLLFFSPENMQLQYFVDVYNNFGKQNMLNELEYAQNYIFANVWMQNTIVVIAPQSGKIIATINCDELVKMEEKLGIDSTEDVLNGIAYAPTKNTFYITGKHWHHIYELAIIQQK